MPVTETHEVEHVVNGSSSRVERTKASLHALLSAATEEGVLFAGASGGGYVFPDFLPAYDALASTGKVLEILARSPATAVGAGRGPAREHARAHPGALPVGGQGHGHAAADRIDQAAAHRPHGRASRCSRRAGGRS